MAITSEEQDQGYTKDGFHLDGDYEVPKFTPEEHQLLRNLAEHARNVETEEQFLEELARATNFYEAIQVYRYNHKRVGSFAKQLREAGESDIPSEALFDRLDIYLRYEGIKDWVARDGGEFREGTAFEEDSVTVKEGFKRLYWK